MKRGLTWVSLVLVLAYVSTTEAKEGKFGLGFQTGINRIYGDLTQTNQREYFGFGFGGFLSYRVLPFADVALGLNFNQLRFDPVYNVPGWTNQNTVSGDLSANFSPFSIGRFRPYLSGGSGLLLFNGNTVATYFGGGGMRYRLSPKLTLFASADYRFADTDRLDNASNAGTAKDGFLTANSGIVYSLGSSPDRDTPDVIAEEGAPFFEVDGSDDFMGFDDQPSAGSGRGARASGGKSMEEYVRLKSRMDQLSGDLDARQREIADLRQRLRDKKQRLASLRGQAQRVPVKRLAKNTSVSSYSGIYEQALTNFYNKEYGEAVELFKLLLQRDPQNSLAGNCQFWLGQSLFELKRYQEAADEFYKVLSYERTLKKDDALFSLGQSYLQMGAGDRARESFVRLLRDFPSSEFTSEAKNYIAKL